MGLMGWVNARPIGQGSPFARSALFLSSITDISHFFCVDGTTNNLRAQGASYLIEKVANMVVAESL